MKTLAMHVRLTSSRLLRSLLLAALPLGCAAYGDTPEDMAGENSEAIEESSQAITRRSDLSRIGTGDGHTIAVNSDGTVSAWGDNNYGQLGDGSTTDRYSPIQVHNLSGVVSVASGASHSVALKGDGTVYAWGLNGSGQLGDGTTAGALVPVQVQGGLTNVISITAGDDSTYALRADGTVWSWGSDDYKQLGRTLNLPSDRLIPGQVMDLSNVVTIAAGSAYCLALKSDGTVWAWGNDAAGQLGDGTAGGRRREPAQVINLTNVVSIGAGGSHGLAVRADGTAYAWGANMLGQLGNGTTTSSATPVAVAKETGLTGVVRVEGGGWHSLAIDSDGVAWAWGSNHNGVLGTNTGQDEILPARVYGGLKMLEVSANRNHSAAIRADGVVWTWGLDNSGELGDGWPPATQIQPVSTSAAAGRKRIAAGLDHSLAVSPTGAVMTWGANGFGQLGDGTSGNERFSPQTLSSITEVTAVSGGAGHSLARKSDGTVWAWGYNAYGQLGDNTTIDRHTPVMVPGLTDAAAISAGNTFSLALRSDGTVWAWGYNAQGQLGDGSTTSRLTPVQVSTLKDVVAIWAGGYNRSMALKGDGTVWAWGNNNRGQLGDGTTKNSSIPVQVAGITNAVDISGGSEHSLAVLADGTAKAWGRNFEGQLGNGTFVDQLNPVTVTNLSNITALAGGWHHTVALLADGTAWSWGDGGLKEIMKRNTPGPVPGITGATTLVVSPTGTHTLVLKQDSTVWGWGFNGNGRIGDGTNQNRPTPVQTQVP